ncbi:MAG: T9SS type A sorting domain-containing protein [Chitinophagaceae bacterium]|nr:MAG: T9SS type A sorting domain-containing protein [Chitinophagaceae bacterium]
MKKLYYLILLLAAAANAQNIVFDGTIFKNKLLESATNSSIAKDINNNNIQIDANNDSEISYAEALAVYHLKVENVNLVNLVGIEYFKNLIEIKCKQNNFATIDVSALTHLTDLDVSSNSTLSSIYAKNGSNENIQLSNTPSLTYICADESQIASLSSGSPAYMVNSYCSVTPGGDYNTLTGQILYDADNNSATPNTANAYLKLVSNINGSTLQTTSKANGEYNLYTTDAGNYGLTPNIENPSWFTITPVSGVFSNTPNNIASNTFLLAPNGIHNDVEVSIRPVSPPIGSLISNVTYEIVFRNKGTQSHSGQVVLNFNQLLLLYVSSTAPVSSILGTVTHNYSNLAPFETRSFNITMATVALLPVGSNVPVNISIDSASETASTQNDNSFTYNQKVASGNNFNAVECLEGETQPVSQIGNYLHYAINFENAGSQVAKNVTIKTVLDGNKYDINSIQVLSATHPLDLRVRNNEVFATLLNADIGGPGGQGGILLKIKTKSTMPAGSTAILGAEIFFDYRETAAPVVYTPNVANTTFGVLNVSVSNHDESIVIYPNPSQSDVFVHADNNEIIRSIELYDATGRLLQTNIANTETAKIDLTQRTSGIYFLKVTTDKGQKVQKIIRK